MNLILKKNIILIVGILFNINLLCAQSLNGTYTIGNTSADFDSISHAIDSLIKYGVSGPVTFNIQEGTYEEQIIIPEILGTNSNNRIEFRSESGNKNDVTIQFDSGGESPEDFVIKLFGADFFTFKDLTIKSLNSYEGSVITFENSCNHNQFDNNIIESPFEEGPFGKILISAEDTCDSYNIFTNNEFINGSLAILLSTGDQGGGEIPPPKAEGLCDTANTINGNTFTNQSSGAINSFYSIDLGITSNEFIINDFDLGGVDVIFCEENIGTTIKNNTIISLSPGTGIVMEMCGSSGNPGLIANNFISFSGMGNSKGIYFYQSSFQNIYYNTLRIEAEEIPEASEAQWGTYGIEIDEGNDNNLLNNIIAVINGYPVYIGYSNSVLLSDYNDFYRPSGSIGYWDGSYAGSLSQWQSVSGMDNNSISTDPLFEEELGYHTYCLLLNAKGTPVIEVTDDLDGEARDAVTPDIGADEFTPPENDAGVSGLINPIRIQEGSHEINVQISNYGYNGLDSTVINWEINGTLQSPVIWQGAMATGNSEQISLGNFNFSDQIYTFKFWTSLPNGTSDDNAENDTLFIKVYPPFSGIYTIGGTDPDFMNFENAISELKIAGVKANTTFKVRPGTYSENLSINEIPGIDIDNQVVFESEDLDSTSVIIENNLDNPVIELDSADYITFRKFTIRNTEYNYSTIISLKNGASNNVFRNNIIESGLSLNNTLISSGSGTDNNNTFSGNIFRNGRYGLSLSGSYNNYQSGNVISDNFFINQERSALTLSSQSSLTISNNTIESSNYTSYEGIEISSCNNGLAILNNKINITNGGKGIDLYNCDGNLQDRAIIANNFIVVLGSTISHGFYIQNSDYLNLYHNNINIKSSYNSGTESALYISSGGYLRLTNNIISNQGVNFSIYCTSSPNIQFSDYNDIYSEGMNIAFWDEDLQTLTQWQNKSGQDAHSFSVDPMYVSEIDLHVRQALLYQSGLALPEIDKDIDGENRNLSNPCIGADEFMAPQVDAGITELSNPLIPFSTESQDIEIVLKNFGLDTLKTVDIHWEFNGLTQSDNSWSGNLITGDTVKLRLGNVNFIENTENSIKVWVSSSNGMPDTDSSNDTILVSLYKALSGVYTIGGTNPTFPTITDAINVMLNGGITAPVTFNIREGIYKETIYLRDFPGSSSENTVTFQSEDLDSSKVIIENETDTSTFIIGLSGVSNIRFKHLKINRTNNVYANLLELRNNSTHILFENNIFHNAGDNTGACIYSDASENNNITIYNNNIYEGSYGVNLSGTSSARTKYNLIRNNTFSGQRNYSIYLYYHESPKIENNIFNNQFANNPSAACYLSYCSDSIKISKNKIDLQESRYGIYLYRCVISGYKSRIMNNFISVGQVSSYSIYLYYCENISMYFNNINVNGGTSSRGIHLYYGSGNILYYNNIINSGLGYALYLNNSSSLLTSDRNNLFTNGTTLVYCSGARPTLADWQSYSNKDRNSLSTDPLYTSTSDLHVKEYKLKRAGSWVTGIIDDIDNDLRNTTNPDIGADEFELLQRDIGIIEIQNFGAGEKTVSAELMNFGLETLTTASVNWSVNDVIQAPVSWSGTLASEDTSEVALGTYTFQNGQQYTVKVWTSSPNGLSDENTNNDTLEIVNKSTSLSGIYTIGGDTPDYTTFAEAVNDLIIKGITDSVIFDVRTGDYNERISIPKISGADGPDAIVFQSESGTNTDVSLYYNLSTSSLNYTIQMDGASGITFRNMEIKANNSSYSRVIEMKNNCEDIKFQNTIIEGYNTSSTSSNFALIYTSLSSNLEFTNNTFINGSYGVNTYQYSTNEGLKIAGNVFQNQYCHGVYLRYEASPEITDNTITTSSTYNTYYGVYLSNSSSYKINNNKITLQNNGYGITLTGCNSSEINKGLIYNNFIVAGSTYYAEGIQLQNSSHINVYFNNIAINSTHTSYGRCIDVYNTEYINLKNNILYNAGGGYAMYFGSIVGLDADHNDYFTEGTNLGYYSGAFPSLAEWQLMSGQDANSFTLDPMYTAIDDLHVGEIALYQSGIDIPSITTDIDGDTRYQQPCIGADEFTIDPSDAGVTGVGMFMDGLQDLIAVIKNYGSDTLKSVEVRCQIDDADFSTINWIGELLTNDTVHINLGDTTFNSGQSYQIKSWTYLPNGTTDSNAENDTLLASIYPAMSGEYTIGGTTPNFNSFYDAVEALKTYGVADSVLFKVRTGIYNEQIIIPEIEGVQNLNTIIFTSETNTNTDVELVYSSTSSSQNYTLQLDGANGVTFKNITVKALGSSYSRIVELKGINENIIFTNNIFEGYNNPTASTTYSISIASFNGKNKNISILNNTFNYSSYAIYLDNDMVLNEIFVNNNSFNNQSLYGIYLYMFSAIEAINNTFNTNSQRSDYYAIGLIRCANQLNIYENKISVPNGGTGIFLDNYEGTEIAAGLISNNFISIGGISNSTGIYSSSSNYLDIYYNSVNIVNTNTSSKALYENYGENINIKNNNLVNSGGAYNIYVQNPQENFESDYNNLYTVGSFLAYWNSEINNLSEWQSYTNNDANSVSADPMFISQDDLHVKEILLDGSGTPIVNITNDIDGETRNATNPDIGADEFEPLDTDAGIISMVSPVNPFLHGEHDISVILRNFSSDTLKSVDVNWEFNGVSGTTNNWTGNLTPAQSIQVILGNKNFVPDTVNYLKAWTSNPGGSADLNNLNDTLFVDSIFTALDGYYTIGGTEPDFDDFSDAVEHLQLRGITGDVQFNVRNGIYQEQIEIPEIIGAGNINSIVFTSESSDSTAVTLQYINANSNDNYIVHLNGADGITFKNLTIKNLNSSYGRVIYISNESNNNTFENNILAGISTTSTNTNLSVIYSYNSTDNYNTFKSNFIKDGSYGIHLRGQSSTNYHGINNKIINNTFENQYYYGTYAYYQKNFVLENNIIRNQNSYSNYSACYLSQIKDSISVQYNKIDLQSGINGIYLYQYQGEALRKSWIANNFITIGGDQATSGIHTYYSNTINVCFNSINLTNTNSASECIYIYRGSDNALHNNICVNTGGGYAINIYYTSAISLMDCNNYYVTGNYLGYLNANRIDLDAWQSASGKDANSVSIDPTFISTNDLHIREVSLDNKGIPVQGITKDIDGETRDLNTPDMGADEFTPDNENDAGILAVTAPSAPFMAGDNDVKVVIRNFGIEQLDSVQINWTCNNIEQPPFLWKGYLPSTQKDTISIGSFFFNANIEYTIKAWTSSPNGQDDANLDNDSTQIDNIYTALNGVYSVGPTNSDFSSFSEAIHILNVGGVSGHVLFNVADGTYNEQLLLGEIPGASSYSTITFQGASFDSTAVNLSFVPTNAQNYVIKLDGTDYMTFKNLTIQSGSSSYNRAVHIGNGAHNNSFQNNIIKATPGYNNYEVITSDATVDNNLQISNNVISNGGTGLNIRGSSGNYEDSIIIIGNIFENQYSKAIVVQYSELAEIKQNIIKTNSSSTSFRGIEIMYAGNSYDIVQNKIEINNGGYALYFYYASTNNSNRALIANNFIQIGGSSYAYGIYNRYSSYQDFYHNNIHITSSHSTYGRCFYTYSSSYVNVYNNIFSNSGNGYSYYVYSSNNVANSDHNDIYTTGSNYAYWGSSVANLAALQSLSGKDQNSLSVDPLYTSPTDLHVEEIALNKAGIPLAEVTTDIDNEPRNPSTPDIGADEFMPVVSIDAGIISMTEPIKPFSTGDNDIKIVVKNFGTDTLKQVDVNWEVNEIGQTTFNWIGSIPSGNIDTLSIGIYDFIPFIAHDLKVWTSNPNGSIDQETDNDTLQIDELYAALQGEYTIGGNIPDFTDITDAITVLEKGGITGEVTFNIRAGNYTENLLITEIEGSDSSNVITFKSETNDSSSVVINSPLGSTIKLNGADFITFNNISIKRPSNGRVIELYNGANNNVFANCIIEGTTIQSSANSYAVVYSGNSHDEYNRFSNNIIRGGSYGILLYGVSNLQKENETVIINNVFTGQYAQGIALYNNKNSLIERNTILGTSNYTNFRGVLLSNVNYLRFYKNIITINNSGLGLYMYNCRGTSEVKNTIANNFISIGGQHNSKGIEYNTCNNTSFYFNTVHVYNTYTGSNCIYLYNSSSAKLYNNIFTNTGGGYAYYAASVNSISESDYNNLFATGTNLGYWYGDIADIGTWKSTTSKDANSVSVNPYYVSDTDLHVSEISLKGAGLSIPGITDDIDGEQRNVTNPDIGADEFVVPASNDAGILAMNTPKLPFNKGNNDVNVVVKNYGMDDLTSVYFNWSINEIEQQSYYWTGSVMPGKTDTIKIGSYFFKDKVAHDLKLWTSLPNAVADSIGENDTLFIEGIYPSLSGTYTVGEQDSDFTDPEEAINVMQYAGVSGPVEFVIKEGVYNNKLDIKEIIGASQVNQILFRSELNDSSSVIISAEGEYNSNYTLCLDGADYLNFKYITLQNTNTNYGRVIEIKNGANNNEFVSLTLLGINVNSIYSNKHELVYSSGANNTDNKFINCLFSNGTVGMSINGYGDESTGILIESNEFKGQFSGAISLSSLNAPVVRRNTIKSSRSSLNGISLYNCDNNLLVTDNKIAILGNGRGISLSYCRGSVGNKGIVVNNFVTVGRTANSQGINCVGNNLMTICFNNINLLSTDATASAIYYDGGSNNQILNNNFASNNNGYAYYVNDEEGLVISNYNNLYSSTGTLAFYNVNCNMLTEFQNQGSKDDHSLNVNPAYISDTDLHVRELTLKNAGTNIPDITTDIDGDVRNVASPDIGADEFIPPSEYDAGILAVVNPQTPFTEGLQNVELVLKNYGYITLDEAEIDWIVNNELQSTINWSGSIEPGKSDTVIIGTYEFSINTPYEIKAWSSEPNGRNDDDASNDTILIKNLYTALDGIYTIGGTDPDFYDFVEAADNLNYGGVEGQVEFVVRSDSYNNQIQINNITGAGLNSNIRFRSESNDSSAVILEFSSDIHPYIVTLNGAEYISFEEMTIRNNGSFGGVILLKNGAGNIQIKKNILEGTENSSDIIYAKDLESKNIEISNNLFKDGSTGVYFIGNYETPDSNIVIEQNNFINQLSTAINLTYQKDPQIKNNTITMQRGQSGSYGILMNNCIGITKVHQNKLSLLKDGTGIYIGNLEGDLLEKAIIANNFISVKSINHAVGIRANNNSFVDIYYNNIRVQSSIPENDYAFDYQNYNGSENVSILNNIFANYGGTHAAIFRSDLGISNCDYNNLYSSGDKLVYMSEDYTTIEDWRVASGFDIHSLSLNPLYYSDFDLHVQQLALDSVGISVSNVSVDIDGDVRNTSYPDIGADEFEPLLSDLGIISIEPTSGCELTQDEEVRVTIQNYSTQRQTDFEITYILNDSLSVTETCNDTILPGKTFNYSFSALADLSKITVHQFKAYTDLTGDQNRFNDTLLHEVTNLPKFEINVTRDTSICSGSSIYISASQANNYLWNTGETYPTISVSPTEDTYYSVTASNYIGCTDTDSVEIKIRTRPEVPVVSALSATDFCYGDSVVLSSSITENIKWQNGFTNPVRTIFATGNYYVLHTDSTGCSSKSNVVSVYEEPKAYIAPLPYTSICMGDSIKLTVEKGLTYSWSTGDITKSIYVSPVVPTTYSVTATTTLGCSYTDEILIDVISSVAPGAISEMLPFDQADGLSLPLDLSWSPASDATHYDIYIWPVDQPKPLSPAIRNVSSIRYKLYRGTIDYGGSYKWQVVSKYYGCQETAGSIQEFTIRHLPDVIVTDVQIPESVFAGETIDITWEVTNQGDGNTVHQHWKDNVYLSVDSVFDPSFLLGPISNMTYLEPGQSYTKTASFKLPYNLDGDLYVFIWANHNNELLESDKENNKNRALEPLWIKINPPPDLYVSKIITPRDVFSENFCNISWEVINKGYKTAKPGQWYDEVYISENYNTARRYNLGKFIHNGELDPDSTYSNSASVELPVGIFGRHYFYVKTDFQNVVYEHAYDGNNLGQSDSVNVILTPPPDLYVANISIPDTTTNRSYIPVNYTVRNQGNAAPKARDWFDRIYLTTSPDTNLTDAYTFEKFMHLRNGIPESYSYNAHKVISIPNFIEPGEYYIYVQTDDGDDVFEHIYNENNITRSGPISIGIEPWPDLQVSSVEVPDTACAGDIISLNYTIANNGTDTAYAENRIDRITISTSNEREGVFIKRNIVNSQSIAPGASVNNEQLIQLPSGFSGGSGNYFIVIEADIDKNIYEHTDEENNLGASDTLFIRPADRAIIDINTPITVYAGETLSFNWQIENKGTAQTALSKWLENYRLYRTSNNSELKSKNFYKNGPVKSGAIYSNGVSYTIPHGITGTFKVRANTSPDRNEENKADNTILSDTINIIMRESPDLVVQSITVPDTGIAGQPIPISWTVNNWGLGNTISGGWSDGIYLSSNPYLDIYYDKKLGVSNRLGNVNAGGSYTQNREVDLPIWANGYYYIIIKTDYFGFEYYGREYEHLAENNNIKVIYMKIVQPPPSDLEVKDIIVPSSAITGNMVSIDWTLTNNGPNKAKGKMTDMVYFSRDTQWDINDVFVGEVPLDIDINPGETIDVNLTTELKGVSVGDYYVIVKTDNRNNIYEVSDENNASASVSVVDVDVPEIRLNEPITVTLHNDNYIYYRFEAVDTLLGETLLATLKGDSANATNEIYWRYGDVPTRSEYDYSYGSSFCGNQELIDPSLKPGTYYLMVYGNTSVGENQQVQLLLSLLNFQVRSVEANSGGNTGNVTIMIKGSKFKESTTFRLEGQGDIIQGDTMIYVDPIKVFVTFNLDGADLGYYNVVAEQEDGEITSLDGGFLVEETSPLGFVSFIDHPPEVLLGTTFSLKIQYANEGNVDIPLPNKKLVSLTEGVPIAFSLKELESIIRELPLDMRELHGPQHILRPGAISSIIVFSKATTRPRIGYKIKGNNK